MECLTHHPGSTRHHHSVRCGFCCSTNDFRQELPVAQQETENEPSGSRFSPTLVQPEVIDNP